MNINVYVKSILLITAVFALKCLKADEEEYRNVTAERHGRQFLPAVIPVFGVGLVRFVNGLCTGYGNLAGTCYTRRQCNNANGVPSTSCAKSIGVCCVITRTCGQSSQINNTYFVSPGFPTTYSGAGVCTFTIQKIDANVCQVRIDFLTLRLAQPNADGNCITDAMVITGGASTVPILCGENSGQHMYVDFNGNTNIVISIGTTGTIGRAWNIRVTQINCNCPTRAPSGCLQYFNTTTGTVTSFNYGLAATQDGTRQLANQNYGVCIGMIRGYCGITWSRTNAQSFRVSGNTYTAIADNIMDPTITGEMSGVNCLTDFIVIPSPVLTNPALNTDRFCGNGFATVTSNTKPFVLTVVTDANELNDLGNTGFSLNYAQTRCPVITTT